MSVLNQRESKGIQNLKMLKKEKYDRMNNYIMNIMPLLVVVKGKD